MKSFSIWFQIKSFHETIRQYKSFIFVVIFNQNVFNEKVGCYLPHPVYTRATILIRTNYKVIVTLFVISQTNKKFHEISRSLYMKQVVSFWHRIYNMNYISWYWPYFWQRLSGLLWHQCQWAYRLNHTKLKMIIQI